MGDGSGARSKCAPIASSHPHIATTANNPSAIGPYGGDFSDPPTQQEMRDYRDYQESLRQALMR